MGAGGPTYAHASIRIGRLQRTPYRRSRARRPVRMATARPSIPGPAEHPRLPGLRAYRARSGDGPPADLSEPAQPRREWRCGANPFLRTNGYWTTMKSVPIRMILLFIGLPATLAMIFDASVVPLLAAYAAWLILALWGARAAGGGTNGRLAGHLPGAAYMLFLILVLPVALASVVAASWTAVLIAYAIWFGLLGAWAVQGLSSRGVTRGEAVGWPAIISMFLTMVAVPLLTLVLRIAGVA